MQRLSFGILVQVSGWLCRLVFLRQVNPLDSMLARQLILEGLLQRHDMHLSLYPLIPYSQSLYHSVTVGGVNNMLFIGTPFYVTH